MPQQAKKRFGVYTKKLVFKGKRRKIHIHQRAFKVFVGDPRSRAALMYRFGLLLIVFGKGVFWTRGLFRKVHVLEILEILESPQIVEDKGESDHFLEILENSKF